MVFAFLQPDTARNVLLILLGVGYFGYHTLRWWRRRPKKEAKARAVASTEKANHHCPPPPPPQPLLSTLRTQPPVESATGEALYLQARAIPHQEVPDFDSDGPYLKLLGDSSAQGYAPASAKLGDYAMRRAAWVEAYYWMSLAKRQGMQGLANVMREIRKNWSMDDFPDQASNVNRLFTIEAGSLGRALLHVDSGREAAKAKEFLKANYPEFVSGV